MRSRTMLQDLLAAVGTVDHPFMKPGAAGAPAGVILMTADKGLGRRVQRQPDSRRRSRCMREDAEPRWYPVGNKARNAVRRLGAEAVRTWHAAERG